MENDRFAVVRQNADALASVRLKLETGETLVGADAAKILSSELNAARGDPAQTAEALFRAGETARDILPDTASRLSFVRTIAADAKISETDLFPVLGGGDPIRVLYARVGAADRAYRLVSSILSDPRVGYAESSSEAAEGVENGDADLLLLPYADAAGNPVLSSDALTKTHGLYLAALARVGVGEGLTYGLFGRAILPGLSGRLTLHLSIPSPDADLLADLFAFARGAGLIPSGARLPDAGRADCAFTGRREDCLAAAVFALTFCPGAELRGWRVAQPLFER